MVRVKICGITRLSDALEAVREGADALGFVFAPSPRRISANEAKKIIQPLPPFIIKVGVFVNERPERILDTVKNCGLNAVQLHGDETPEEARYLGERVPVIKAFRVKEGIDVRRLNRYRVSAFLFDTYVSAKPGGSGKVFDWNLVKSLKLKVPVILSGGLTPQNAAFAVSSVKPYGVDVSSGVESAPGKKNQKLVRAFIREVKK